MGLTIIYWLPIIFFGFVYILKLSNDIANSKVKNKET